MRAELWGNNMVWKLKLAIVLSVLLVYFAYVQANMTRATAGVDRLKSIYSNALDQADQINSSTPGR